MAGGSGEKDAGKKRPFGRASKRKKQHAACPGSVMAVAGYREERKLSEKQTFEKGDLGRFVSGGDIRKEQVSHFLECVFFERTS